MQSNKYERVALIGVDGAGTFFNEADTPNLDRIFASGAKNPRVLTSEPTISAECWGSMLHGVRPEIHRLTNGIVSTSPFDINSEFPSVFRVIRENMPNAVLASFCNWNPINYGIIENNLGVVMDTAGDEELTGKICVYLADNAPTFLFVQFDEVDGAGHANGYGTPAHLAQITKTDALIERIYRAYEKRGLLDGTLFIVTADHGGTPGGSHGGSSDAEKYVMLAATGKTVIPGKIAETEIRDCASIVLYALGLGECQPKSWTSRVPSDLFEGVRASARPSYVPPQTAAHRRHESVPSPDSDIKSVLNHRLLAYLPFEGNADDICGGDTKTAGKLYYIDGYYGKGVRLDDGYVKLCAFNPDKRSFTVAAWFKANGIAGDPCLCSNKDWKNGVNRGFVLSLRGSDMLFNIGDGVKRMDAACLLPLDYRDGWVHIIFTADRERNVVSLRTDFGKPIEAQIPPELSDVSFNGADGLNIGQDGTGKYGSPLTAVIDDFIILDGVIGDEEADALKAFYTGKI